MDHYKKSSKFNEKLIVRILGLEEKTVALIVTPGTQIRSLLPSALEMLKKDGQILWVGCGSASDKAVACAEATKSRHKGLHQVTQITTKRIEEFWEPSAEGMNTLKVIREVPAIALLLSVNKPTQQQPEKYMQRIFCDGSDV